MFNQLIELVKQANVDDWKLVETITKSHQAYFVKQELDQHRISDVVERNLTIYLDKEVEGKKMRGSASHSFFPDTPVEEIKEEIEKMKYNASIALNPYYELVKDEKHNEDKKDYQLIEVLKTVVSAIQNVKNTETEKINSYEIFVNEYFIHIVNSQGVDVSFNSMDEEIEVIINSIDGDKEIELYHRVSFANQPLQEITQGILDVFKYAKDRTKAVGTKKALNQRVLLTSLDNAQFFRYFLMKTRTSVVYSRGSQVKIGDKAQSGDNCDRISVELKAELPYSSKNLPYSNDGAKAKDSFIVKDGEYVAYWGDHIPAYYLGVKDASCANNYVVSGGSKTLEQLHQDPYLEIIQFSSFIMNPLTGTFGGEIRLAYYFDGNNKIAVTGGSITCNFADVLNDIRMSKETRQIDNCIVPVTIEIQNVAVAGEE